MKKLFILITTIIPCTTFSADMCVRNDTVMTVFDPLTNGLSDKYDNTNKTWSVTFSYGVIRGIAGNSTEIQTEMGTIATNQNAITRTSTGNYCYCKILYPFLTPWVFRTSDTSSTCPRFCAYLGLHTNASFRRAMFNAIIQK